MAVLIREIAFCGGANVGEDEVARRLRSEAFEVNAVPCWDGGGEDAWFGTQIGIGVVAYAEAIAVVRTTGI